MCVELPCKRRTKLEYDEQLKMIENSTKIEFKETKGIAMYCALNDLKYFHMLDSMAPDIMHDVNEGAIPFLLKNLFEYVMKHKVCDEKKICNKT